MHQKRLPLECYGTGVHQLVILCAALAMHDNYIVCIEEPEIHLHPELQHKFIQFIADETTNQYFITTHSSVFLDTRMDVGIYHVVNDGTKSTVVRIEATPQARRVLEDLGYKASDLLQANCVVWVEGSSDRIYLNGWLRLMAPGLIEGIHYAITFYGGKVLAHFTGSDAPDEDLVEVFRINRHAIFVMDRDNVQPRVVS
jgi:predicted ATP-dependent endonuclease of OLD family